MSVYLHDIPLAQARARIREALQEANLWRVLGVEEIPLNENALGRVTAEPIWAEISSPHYHASAMDGFAVRAISTNGAMPSSPVTLHVGPEAQYVDTGDPLPEWTNAVIPIENVESLDENDQITKEIRKPASIRIRSAVAPWSHVRPLGEDIVATQLVLPAGHALRPADLGAIAASGHQTIRVALKPKVAILPTGTELVPIGSKLKSGDILEYNSLVLAAQIKQMGGEPTRYPITRDDFGLICERVFEASQSHDLVLLNAGSSAGAEDFSSKVVEKLGTLLVHGVAVRPGHPVILGMVNRQSENLKPETLNLIPIIGVPGYPVSAALTVDIFVEALIAKWLGRPPMELPTETATLTRKLVSPAGDDDFVRVAVGQVGDKLLAAPLSRGAGVITSLVQADGLALIPSGVQGMEAGEPVKVHLYRSKAQIEKTIFCIGSHDMTLDLLAQFLAEHDRRLASANVGSQGGLVALRRGEAHMAGSHLLDPSDGSYNIAYIRQYMPNIPVKVVSLVGRDQGLIVKKGNPKGIKSLGDLTSHEVQFVNRQRGAGTRVLLDYHLNLMGMSSESISGYTQEEYTHLGVAAAVASGRADCGLGIAAAAQALELDFVPLFQERYDLVMPKVFAESELLAPLFDLLTDPVFRNSVSKLTGYDVNVMGRIIMED
ncbi:MAG TPA: molybdopterin biosynthesis protein [Anaerolineales bacterium]|nr:molybdopterin biosynthesis protein [Anaerolineales bacterium]HNA53576.1 molybdopterin biosynthesis protein [Anaerolineales bacterium]HNC88025.1 molybdopterin biosynthesis protein [Anaerolineales bacterium]HNE67277.1 molybdopterin biosynthesis protein [Anaerolineales bacterium]HNF34806.1 molybdopterin biosynthesis protein [Anaerolineales bacterium]